MFLNWSSARCVLSCYLTFSENLLDSLARRNHQSAFGGIARNRFYTSLRVNLSWLMNQVCCISPLLKKVLWLRIFPKEENWRMLTIAEYLVCFRNQSMGAPSNPLFINIYLHFITCGQGFLAVLIYFCHQTNIFFEKHALTSWFMFYLKNVFFTRRKFFTL